MIESAARACPQCGKPLVRRKQKYCGHKCAFAVIGHKVRAAATTPSALKKIGNALRGRGRKYGHALTPDNIGLTTRGARRCIICRRAYDNEWKKARRREQAKFGASHRRTEQ